MKTTENTREDWTDSFDEATLYNTISDNMMPIHLHFSDNSTWYTPYSEDSTFFDPGFRYGYFDRLSNTLFENCTDRNSCGIPYMDDEGFEGLLNNAILVQNFFDINGETDILQKIWSFFNERPKFKEVLRRSPDAETVAAYLICDRIPKDPYCITMGNMIRSSIYHLGKYVGQTDECLNRSAAAGTLCHVFSDIFNFAGKIPKGIAERSKDENKFSEILEKLFLCRTKFLMDETKYDFNHIIGFGPRFLFDIICAARNFEKRITGNSDFLPHIQPGLSEPSAEFRFVRAPRKKSRSKTPTANPADVFYAFNSRCLRFEIHFTPKKNNYSIDNPVKALVEEGAYGQGELRKYRTRFTSFTEALEHLSPKVVSDDAFSNMIGLDEV